jgi:DNA-binding IclR family transcriptional regulator
VTGYSVSRVHQVLADLTTTGQVERVGHGRYRLPTTDLDAGLDLEPDVDEDGAAA